MYSDGCTINILVNFACTPYSLVKMLAVFHCNKNETYEVN